MKNISNKLNLVAMLASLVLAGCATDTPQFDSNFGNAVNSAKALQTINPDASLEADSGAGVGGKPADAAMDRYHQSFEKPPAETNVFNIGVGNSGN